MLDDPAILADSELNSCIKDSIAGKQITTSSQIRLSLETTPIPSDFPISFNLSNHV